MSISIHKRIGVAAFSAAILMGSAVPLSPARAAFVVTLDQDGPDVVATGSGTIDLTGLTFVTTGPGLLSLLFPSFSYFAIAPSTTAIADDYRSLSLPPAFGAGGFTFASSATGDIVSIDGAGDLNVPAGYVSGTPLSDRATWVDATFASLGITPGVYEWTWGSGAHADNITLIAGAAAPAPELSTWAMVLTGFAGLGFATLRASRRTADGARA